MYIVCVTVHVNPDHINEFEKASIKNASATHGEPGSVRFDVLRATDGGDVFLLYEVYDDEEAFAAHQRTRPYLEWKEAVADWMAAPRTKVVCTEVFPTERSLW